MKPSASPIKPMTVDEAILQMNLWTTPSSPLRRKIWTGLSVVYRRNDGGYGIIEDEA